MKHKIIKARSIIEELYELNNENIEILSTLMEEDELVDRYGEELESLKANLEKIYSLL